MSQQLAGRETVVQRERESVKYECWAKNDEWQNYTANAVLASFPAPCSLLPSPSSWHVTTNEDQLWLDILLFCYCYFCFCVFLFYSTWKPNYGIEFPGILTFHLLVSSWKSSARHVKCSRCAVRKSEHVVKSYEYDCYSLVVPATSSWQHPHQSRLSALSKRCPALGSRQDVGHNQRRAMAGMRQPDDHQIIKC